MASYKTEILARQDSWHESRLMMSISVGGEPIFFPMNNLCSLLHGVWNVVPRWLKSDQLFNYKQHNSPVHLTGNDQFRGFVSKRTLQGMLFAFPPQNSSTAKRGGSFQTALSPEPPPSLPSVSRHDPESVSMQSSSLTALEWPLSVSPIPIASASHPSSRPIQH